MAKLKGDHALSNAERQAAYRARKKAQGLTRRDEWELSGSGPRPSAESDKARLAREWRKKAQAEEIKAVRKAARKKEQDKHYHRGYYTMAVFTANFFIQKNRPDIARELLHEFSITRPDCLKNGLKDFSLQALDKAEAFNFTGHVWI